MSYGVWQCNDHITARKYNTTTYVILKHYICRTGITLFIIFAALLTHFLSFLPLYYRIICYFCRTITALFAIFAALGPHFFAKLVVRHRTILRKKSH